MIYIYRYTCFCMFLLQGDYWKACRNPVAGLVEGREPRISPRVCSDTQGNLSTQRPDIHEGYCHLRCDAMKL